MAEKKKSKSGLIDSFFVRLSSFEDLVRNVWLGDGVSPIYSVKQKSDKLHRMMALSLKVDGTKLVLYYDSKKCDEFAVYMVAAGQQERIELTRSLQMAPLAIGTNYIPIIELANSPFIEAKKKPEIKCIMAKDAWTIVKSVIGASMNSGRLGKVYVFKYKGKRYAGSFNVVNDDDANLFCYAQVDADKVFSFFRYNYQEGKLEPTTIFGEHGFLYCRVINLAEPFPFFRPD